MSKFFNYEMFIDFLEGRLSSEDAQKFLDELHRDPVLAEAFAQYKAVVVCEKTLGDTQWEPSPAFEEKVLAKLEQEPPPQWQRYLHFLFDTLKLITTPSRATIGFASAIVLITFSYLVASRVGPTPELGRGVQIQPPAATVQEIGQMEVRIAPEHSTTPKEDTERVAANDITANSVGDRFTSEESLREAAPAPSHRRSTSRSTVLTEQASGAAPVSIGAQESLSPPPLAAKDKKRAGDADMLEHADGSLGMHIQAPQHTEDEEKSIATTRGARVAPPLQLERSEISRSLPEESGLGTKDCHNTPENITLRPGTVLRENPSSSAPTVRPSSTRFTAIVCFSRGDWVLLKPLDPKNCFWRRTLSPSGTLGCNPVWVANRDLNPDRLTVENNE